MNKTVLMDWMLIEVQQQGRFKQLTWDLLQERDESVNISHKDMPTWEQHCDFVCSHPYRTWKAIMANGLPVGTIYLTKQNEVGIFILKEHQGNGYAKDAIMQITGMYHPLPSEPSTRPGCFVAHVNPSNTASVMFFMSLGAKHISNTYQL